MIRTLSLVSAAALAASGGPGARTNPDACKLFSAPEASKLAGATLTLTHREANATIATCAYGTSDPRSMIPSVQVSYGDWPDANTAHTRFLKRVQPGATQSPLSTVTSVPKLGDEATIKQTPKLSVSSIDVRQGTLVVSLGVMPVVSDSVLEAAARTALSRLP
jgi:hypothetical protein